MKPRKQFDHARDLFFSIRYPKGALNAEKCGLQLGRILRSLIPVDLLMGALHDLG